MSDSSTTGRDYAVAFGRLLLRFVAMFVIIAIGQWVWRTHWIGPVIIGALFVALIVFVVVVDAQERSWKRTLRRWR